MGADELMAVEPKEAPKVDDMGPQRQLGGNHHVGLLAVAVVVRQRTQRCGQATIATAVDANGDLVVRA